jgi:hypothetical protein
MLKKVAMKDHPFHAQKCCSVCHLFKPKHDFVRDRTSRDGRHHRCLTCARKHHAERKENGALAAMHKKWRQRHPLAAAAHVKLRRAVRRGELERQPCTQCSSTQTIHGHHPDYSRPLEVVWLCQRCHTEIHRLERLYAPNQFLLAFMRKEAA